MRRMACVVVLAVTSVAWGGEIIEQFKDPKVQEQVKVCLKSIEERYAAAEDHLVKLVGQDLTIETKHGPKSGELTGVRGHIALSVKLVINRRVVGSSTAKVEWKDVTIAQLDQWDDKWKPKPGAPALHAYVLGEYDLVERLAGRDKLSLALVENILELQAAERVREVFKMKDPAAIMQAIDNMMPAYGSTKAVVAHKKKLDDLYAKSKKQIADGHAKKMAALMRRARHVSLKAKTILNPDCHPSALPGKYKVVDGNRDTKWYGLSPLTLDLKRAYQITHVYLVEYALIEDTYTIEASLDRQDWKVVGRVKTVGNGQLRSATVGNPETQVGRNDHKVIGAAGVVGRYIRISATRDRRVYLNEVEVYGISR